MALNESALLAQSKAAYGQWAEQWREHAKIHSRFDMKPLTDFEHIGIGRPIVCAANGWSLELCMPVLKEWAGKVDVIACDKSLGALIDHGIKPTYVMVCDANVSYKKYLEPWKDRLQDTILFSNVCGNPAWTRNGNWKDIYFFVNRDVLKSEDEFSALSGCKNFIPAGTNVSNAMIVLLANCDNESGPRNFFGYDKMLLVGYDYAWNPKGNYYAYSKDGGGKANYMRHIYTVGPRGDLMYTSTNLAFSAQWLAKYVETFRLPVIQCSDQSIFLTKLKGVLPEQIAYNFRPEDSAKVRDAVGRLRQIESERRSLSGTLNDIGSAHRRALMASVRSD